MTYLDAAIYRQGHLTVLEACGPDRLATIGLDGAGATVRTLELAMLADVAGICVQLEEV